MLYCLFTVTYCDLAGRAVHARSYLDAFKELSDADGGMLGEQAPFGPGSYEIAALSAGLAIHSADRVLLGIWDNAYALTHPPGHHCRCASRRQQPQTLDLFNVVD